MTAPPPPPPKKKYPVLRGGQSEPGFEAHVYGKKLAAKGYRIREREPRGASPGGRPAARKLNLQQGPGSRIND